MAGAITLRIIAPESIVLDTTAESVTVPGVDGSMGILPRHAPMVAAIAPGRLCYKKDGRSHAMFVSAGFAEVREDTVRVVAEASEMPEEIDEERARAAAERARSRLLRRGRRAEGESAADLDTARAEYALRRALMRLSVARRDR